MIANDPNQIDGEPIASEALNQSASGYSDADAAPPVDLPWSRAPVGRRISFTAWGLIAIAGVVMWVAIFKLF